ncbi:MAG: TonB-dependent receptor [Proteobacteria bacterium]|nr:TonB-dependent receptor [Pseudomonadota bacterium]MBU4294708.1 TonB-dependent receptor [Pseudomonadota bacterium]MCG2749793.1 TonB-dependent receptor [Desulfobulbaceae bacterium]
MKKSILAAAVLLAMIDCGAAGADETAAVLDEVVVTATRTDAQSGTIGGTTVTVITQEEIAARKQTTVEEVLKGTPGLDVAANGGPGTNTSIFLRGADAKNTLILVDGIMFNDPSAANRNANIANLTTDNIERIEIVRGPMSVLYGSNATAGVINIITKKGKGAPQSSVGIEGGSYDTWKVYGGSSGSLERLGYSFNVSHIDSNGFSIADDDNERIPHAGNTSEDDGWENSTVSGRVGYGLTPDFDLIATMRYMDSEREDDDYASGYTGDRFSSWPYVAEPYGSKKSHTDTEQYLGRIDAKNRFWDGLLDSNLYYQLSRHDRVNYDNDGVESYDYLGKTQEAGWQGTFVVSQTNDLTLGASFYEEKMESDSSAISEQESETSSVWAQEQLALSDSLDLVAGLRYDDHDRFGGKTTYRVAPSYLTGFGTLFKASFATGFRAPSLYELYSSYGNVNLSPEKSRGWDAGLEQELGGGKVRCGITYFDLTFEDRIAYDYLTSQYQQAAGNTKTKGVETFVQWQAGENLSLSANYTYTDTKDQDDKRLARRPMHKVGGGAQYRHNKARYNLDLYWVGERDESSFAMDSNGNAVETLDSYTVVNLAASYDLTQKVQLYGRIDNLFDEEYEEAWSYATPGLSAYAGVRVTF